MTDPICTEGMRHAAEEDDNAGNHLQANYLRTGADEIDRLRLELAVSRVPVPSFQSRVHDWVVACFGLEIAADKIERNHRFLEESLELVQSCGCTQSEAHQLVDYVFNRDIGDTFQEVGGVMNTLAALCTPHGIDLNTAAEAELSRVWTKVEQIRAKQKAKPKHSPLPAVTPDSKDERIAALEAALVTCDGALEAAYETIDLAARINNPSKYREPAPGSVRLTITAARSAAKAALDE